MYIKPKKTKNQNHPKWIPSSTEKKNVHTSAPQSALFPIIIIRIHPVPSKKTKQPE